MNILEEFWLGKEAAEILQPLCYVGYLSSALASASWKSLVSVKSSFL